MNTFISCVLLAIICRSFVKLLTEGIREEKEDAKEELIVLEYDK